MDEQIKKLIEEFIEGWRSQRTMAREWRHIDPTPTIDELGRYCITQVTLSANNFTAIDELIRTYEASSRSVDGPGR